MTGGLPQVMLRLFHGGLQLVRAVLRPIVVVAVITSLASAGSLFLSGCEKSPALENPSTPPNTSVATAALPSESTAATGPSATTSTSLLPLGSPKDVWVASVLAVSNLGPVKATIRETWTWETINADPQGQAAVSGSGTNDVEELLDPPNSRARMTITSSDGTSKIVTVDGTTKTVLAYLGPDTGGLFTYKRLYLLRKPEGLPLPLYAGSMLLDNEDYTKLLSFGAPAGTDQGPSAGLNDSDRRELTSPAQVTRSGDDHILTWKTPGPQLKPQGEFWPKEAAWSLVVGPDFLPKHLAIEVDGELEGVAMHCSGTVDYGFEPITGLTTADVELKAPQGPCEQTIVRELDPARPYSPQASWRQYWLGPKFGNLSLIVAEHTVYELTPSSTKDEFIKLMYSLPAVDSTVERKQAPTPSVTPTVELRTRPLQADLSRQHRKWAEQRVKAGAWQRAQMTVAGEAAVVYVGAEDDAEELWNATYRTNLWIAVRDTWLEMALDPGITAEEMLPLLQQVR